jgi:hypothetical protein
MIAVVCAVVKQLMELRRGREGNDNQQVSGEQAGECVLPCFGVSKPLHFHPFKALYRPSQNDCCEKRRGRSHRNGARRGDRDHLAGRQAIKVRFDVVNLFDKIYELRDGSGIGVGAPQFGQRRGFYGTVAYDF